MQRAAVYLHSQAGGVLDIQRLSDPAIGRIHLAAQPSRHLQFPFEWLGPHVEALDWMAVAEKGSGRNMQRAAVYLHSQAGGVLDIQRLSDPAVGRIHLAAQPGRDLQFPFEWLGPHVAALDWMAARKGHAEGVRPKHATRGGVLAFAGWRRARYPALERSSDRAHPLGGAARPP